MSNSWLGMVRWGPDARGKCSIPFNNIIFLFSYAGIKPANDIPTPTDSWISNGNTDINKN